VVNGWVPMSVAPFPFEVKGWGWVLIIPLQVPVNMSFRTANFRTSGASAAGETRVTKDLSGQAKGLKAKYPEREGNLRPFRNLLIIDPETIRHSR